MSDSDKLDRILIGQARLETKVESIEKHITENEHQTDARLDAIESWRQGNGVVGIDKRVDRMEQTAKRTGSWLKAIGGLLLAVVAGMLIAAGKVFLFGGF